MVKKFTISYNTSNVEHSAAQYLKTVVLHFSRKGGLTTLYNVYFLYFTQIRVEFLKYFLNWPTDGSPFFSYHSGSHNTLPCPVSSNSLKKQTNFSSSDFLTVCIKHFDPQYTFCT